MNFSANNKYMVRPFFQFQQQLTSDKEADRETLEQVGDPLRDGRAGFPILH